MQDVSKPNHKGKSSDLGALLVKMAEDTEKVGEQDMQDPSMLSTLRSMGNLD